MLLFDTNILVYFTNRDSPFHLKCKELIERVMDEEIIACLAHQNLVEYIHVVTDKRQVASPLSLSKAALEVGKFTQVFEVIKPVVSTMKEFLFLLRKERILKRGRTFDLYLAATMLSNGVGTIYTFNVSDFKDIPGITVKKPL